LQVCEYEVESG